MSRFSEDYVAVLRQAQAHLTAQIQRVGALMDEQIQRRTSRPTAPDVHPARAAIHETRTFGEQAADAVASGMGSWRYIIVQTVFIILWMTLNTIGLTRHWDAAPFILLNLIFSIQASYAAPILQLSGNRQSQKDRIRDDLEAQEVAMLVNINQQQLEILQALHERGAVAAPSPSQPTPTASQLPDAPVLPSRRYSRHPRTNTPA